MDTKSLTDLVLELRTQAGMFANNRFGTQSLLLEAATLIAKQAAALEVPQALLLRCVPPEYMVEPAPRSCDKEWVWDSCDDDWNGYGEADTREQAIADAWVHWRAREKERADDREEAKDLARFEP